MRAALIIGAVAGYGLWTYFTKLRQLNDVRAYHDKAVPYYPQLSTARLDEFATHDLWTHGRAVAAMKEFSRLYQESYLGDTEAATLLRRMQEMRATAMREMHALRLWIPNDLGKDRRMLACIEETDAAMVTALREVADRRGTQGIEPYAGRLRFWDDKEGITVRASNDVWV